MHIGLVIYGSLDRVSGGYLYDRMLVEQWQAAGDTVDLIALPWRSYGRHLLDNLSFTLVARLVGGGYDVIVQDELNHPSLVWLNARLPDERPPLVSIVHHLRSSELHPAWQLAGYREIERRYLAGVDGFIFNSETTRQTVTALLGREVAGVVAYPAADHIGAAISPERIEARAAERPLRLLFVGNVIARKGVQTIIEALALGGTDQWQLTVVGDETIDPAYAGHLREVVGVAGLAGQVHFVGAVESARLVELLSESHILVMPSAYEGFGIVYLEGMAFGLPAIATTAGAAGELVTEGVTGFLVEPGDAVALHAYLERLDGDRGQLARMGVAALARYERHPRLGRVSADGASLPGWVGRLTVVVRRKDCSAICYIMRGETI